MKNTSGHNSYFESLGLKDDDFIFNNNEEESVNSNSTNFNSTNFNDDPFKILSGNHKETSKKSTSAFIKVFTLLFMLMLFGWLLFVIYIGNDPDTLPGNRLKNKISIAPENVQAKPNSTNSDNNINK
ncbi:MAG: hypothetical protein WC139_06175 [Candidatus Kapaibacterium sp.]